MIKRHFSKVVVHGAFKDRGLPVLLIGNHFSWWDGFIAYYLNDRLFRRIYHVMMLEEQLRDRMFLNKAGAFSIDKGKRSMVESLSYAADLLQTKDNLLVLYPQGKFQSIHHRPVQFEKGFVVILEKAAESGFQMIFYVALTDYYEYRKPMLHIYLKEVSYFAGMTADDLEAAYNAFYLGSENLQRGCQ